MGDDHLILEAKLRRMTMTIATLALFGAISVGISACGSDSNTTTVTTTTTEPAPTPTTTSAPTATTSATTVGPADCGSGEVYSSGSHTCVKTNPSGNPCPTGEVPMADQPVCIPKQ
jgi:hypothetical protein